MPELIGRFSSEDLETAGFYARQVVDRVTYQGLKEDFGLPDYDQIDDEKMIGLATMTIAGEFRDLHDNIDYSREDYNQRDFVENALELSGEPVQEPHMLQKSSSQLGDEPVHSDEINALKDGLTVDTEERPPGESEVEKKKKDHYWINIADLTGEFNDLYNAYLPIVDLKEREEEADLNGWR